MTKYLFAFQIELKKSISNLCIYIKEKKTLIFVLILCIYLSYM